MSILELRLVLSKCVRFLGTERASVRKGATPFYVKQYEHLAINQLLHRNDKIDNEKWLMIRKELCDSKDLAITIHNVDSAIVGTCCDAKNATAALSYIKFLKDTNREMNLAAVGKYFTLLYEERKSLDTKETETVFELYDELRAKYPLLDAQTAEYCLLILSMTIRWRECIELLKMLEYSDSSRPLLYNSIAAAAFDNNDYDIGWNYTKLIRPKLHLIPRLLKSYLDYSVRNSKTSEELETHINKMFQFWSDYDIYPELEDVNMYINCLKDTGEWNVNTCTIHSTNGICSACGNRLPKLQINQQDFDYLSKTFFNKVVMGNDIYNNTTPEELQRFTNFVKSTKPYDVVIDGLNAAYSLNHSKKIPDRTEKLAKVVQTFVNQQKKVFVLGRRHMSKWSTPAMNYVKKNSYLFLANDLSEDDPYLLYATLASGINTFFSSRDYMRQHKFLLNDDDSRRIFRHWQLTRQIVPSYVDRAQKQLLNVYPPEFIPIAQKDSNGNWHIPYKQGNVKELQPSHLPKLWLCVNKRTK